MLHEGNNRNAQIWTEIIPAPKAGAMTKLGDIPFSCQFIYYIISKMV